MRATVSRVIGATLELDGPICDADVEEGLAIVPVTVGGTAVGVIVVAGVAIGGGGTMVAVGEMVVAASPQALSRVIKVSRMTVLTTGLNLSSLRVLAIGVCPTGISGYHSNQRPTGCRLAQRPPTLPRRREAASAPVAR